MPRHARLLVARTMWVVAQHAEHRTVTAAGEGSSPFDPPKFLARNCGRGVRHLIVDQADDGSSPFSSAKLNSGCGVTSASESWELVVTVRLCPPRPKLCGSDVAGNMRVFQTRLESSNLSFRSNCARRQVAKALDCKSSIREFESHRALQRSDS